MDINRIAGSGNTVVSLCNGGTVTIMKDATGRTVAFIDNMPEGRIEFELLKQVCAELAEIAGELQRANQKRTWRVYSRVGGGLWAAYLDGLTKEEAHEISISEGKSRAGSGVMFRAMASHTAEFPHPAVYMSHFLSSYAVNV